MRSPRATSSPCWTKGTMRRAMHAGNQPHADFLPARLGGLEAQQHVFIVNGGLGLQGVEKLAGRCI